MTNNKKIRKIRNPDDLRFKRQFLFAAYEIHNFYVMPGVFMYSGPNEVPTDLNQHARSDGVLYVNLDGEKYICNVEDESVKVDEDSLKKSYKYNKKYSDINDGKVFSYIVTPIQLNKCCKAIFPSENVIFKPNLISMTSHYNGEEILNTLTDKILNRKCVLSRCEALPIVMLPRMFQQNQAEILEKACILLKEVKIDDQDFKDELILEMQCTIHKHAETDEDIERLEKVISVETIEGISNYPDNWHLEEFYYMGYAKGESNGISKGKSIGFSKGELNVASKIKEAYGIDEAVRISGLSRDSIENYSKGK